MKKVKKIIRGVDDSIKKAVIFIAITLIPVLVMLAIALFILTTKI